MAEKRLPVGTLDDQLATARSLQPRCEIENCILHFRDGSAEVVIDDPLNGLVLLSLSITSVRFGDSDERLGIECAFEEMVMGLKLTEPSITSNRVH